MLTSTTPSQSLDTELQGKTYLAGTLTPTAADIALLGTLYASVSSLAPADQYAHPSVSRWVSHLSHVFAPAGGVKAWDPQYEGMPKVERKDLAAEKKEKSKAKAKAAEGAASEAKKEGKGNVAASAAMAAAAGAGAGLGAAAEGSSDAAAANAAKKKEKKEKKQKEAAAGEKKEKPPKGGAAAAAEPSTPIPSMVDLRVGKIVGIEKHPDADSLYLEKVSATTTSAARCRATDRSLNPLSLTGRLRRTRRPPSRSLRPRELRPHRRDA